MGERAGFTNFEVVPTSGASWMVFSMSAEREIDIRAFLQQDRERILRAIRKRSTPHLSPSHYYTVEGNLWLDKDATGKPRTTSIPGFVVQSILGVTDDAVIVREEGRRLLVRRFSDIPYEDLMKVSGWVARKLPAPAIAREQGMQAYLAELPSP